MTMEGRSGEPRRERKEEEEEAGERKIRNICIVAHVDHGKTTMADHLIAGGGAGIIHPKQAGKLRYLDYRDDEQQRAITMKSSSIALTFKNHLINLIDSPGHVDFCSEVSTAARLSDGALVLVDACEGVHIQTHAVLRQVWMEKVTPCLVLNKVDRLITELKLTPYEAYSRLKAIISQVNQIISQFRSESYFDSILEGHSSTAGLDEGNGHDEQDEEDAFSPERGNVAFASALDGWAFRIDQFSSLYAAKLGASQAALQKTLWGEYYYIPKTKKIVGKKAAGGKVKSMFVQFVLDPIWQVYDVILQGSQGQEMLDKIVKSMNLTIPARDLQHKDKKVIVQSVMSRWLPLAETIFSMIVERLPDPVSAQSYRIERLLPLPFVLESNNSDQSGLGQQLAFAREAVKVCDVSPGAPCIVFVSKMFAVPVDMLPQRGPNGELLENLVEDLGIGEVDAAHRECFLAFARVFSGVMKAGQKVFILSPFHDPTKAELNRKNIQEATVKGLYMMMGRGLEPKYIVSAGNLVAIRGLGQHILKTATIATTPYCWPFTSMTYQAAPIMRVAIEPSDPAEIGALTRGLRLLNRADPFVEVTISGTGEHVIAAAGEVHLERCIKDLRERFARINLEVSPPLVAFKETIEARESSPSETHRNEHISVHYVEKVTPNGRCTVRVHVTRMPAALTEVLDANADLLRAVIEGKAIDPSLKAKRHYRSDFLSKQEDQEDPALVLRDRLKDAVEAGHASGACESEKKKKGEEDAKAWRNRLQNTWALGPMRVGPNMLLCPDANISNSSERQQKSSDTCESNPETILVKGSAYVSDKLGLSETLNETKIKGDSSKGSLSLLYSEAESLESSIISGFQLATSSGPLCEEPMWGLCFTVEAWVCARGKENTENGNFVEDDINMERYGPFSSQVMMTAKDACRSAMLLKSPRLVEAMYLCEIVTTPEHLGQTYAVLGRRRARILNEEMQEGSAMFTVHAYVPVAESFGFTDELRRKTSGAASPQLVLSHWEALPEDPFFVPKTEEEIEEYGDGSSVPQNIARKLIDAVRRRKGLPVEEKVVQHGTKQRTLARKV